MSDLNASEWHETVHMRKAPIPTHRSRKLNILFSRQTLKRMPNFYTEARIKWAPESENMFLKVTELLAHALKPHSFDLKSIKKKKKEEGGYQPLKANKQIQMPVVQSLLKSCSPRFASFSGAQPSALPCCVFTEERGRQHCWSAATFPHSGV